MENNAFINGLRAFCIIPLVIGIILLLSSESDIEYSTDEFWVAQDYHHVYNKFTGEIEDYISDDESCSIDGGTITVTTTNETMYGWGLALTILFGMFTAGLIIGEIETSEWWFNLKKRLFD